MISNPGSPCPEHADNVMRTEPLQPAPWMLLDKYHGGDFKSLYVTTVTVTGGETGHGRASGVAQSDDGALALTLRLPKAMGGPGGGTNPEQLFAAGYAACFHGALTLLAHNEHVDLAEASVAVTVSFGRDPVDGFYVLSANVDVSLPGVERAVAQTLIRNTERICPYAKMARQGVSSVITLRSTTDR